MSDEPRGAPRPKAGESREVERLRGSLARAETRSAYVAARVAGRLGNELADACVEAGRLADAVAAYLRSPDPNASTLRAALDRWNEHEGRRRRR
jgi:hypothetical protein